MPTVLESLEKKKEKENLEGVIYEYREENESLSNTLKISEPKLYKDFFILEDIGIQKTLKSVLIETKDSLCSIYYILDSSILRLPLEMDYQCRDILKELPLSFISYLRILCSKKAAIRLTIEEDKIFIHFEDTIVKDTEKPKVKLKKGEKREKEIGKLYTLEIPLKEVDDLDRGIIEYIEDFPMYIDVTDKFPTSINLDSFNSIDLPFFYNILSTDKGDFKIVHGGRLNIWYLELPIEVSLINSRLEESIELKDYGEEYEVEDIEDIGEEIYQEFMDDYYECMDTCYKRLNKVDAFLLGDIDNE